MPGPPPIAADPRHPLGRSIPRVDGVDKVTGRALYVDDLPFEGGLIGRTIRSSVPHGRLVSIELDPDFDWSDVVVVTADDIPGANVVTLIEPDQPALVPVGGVVRHVDEAIALLAAPTRERVQEAAEHVRVTIEPFPAIHSIEAALAAEVELHGSDNVFKRFEILHGDDVEAALTAADLVIEGIYRTSAQEQMYIETQGAIAEWDEDLTRCRVTGSIQCPYYVHKALVPLLDLEEDAVIVTQSVTGGGFGGKEEYPSMIASHAALLAKKAKRPVKIVYDRVEDIRATTKRHPALIRHRLGVMRDGTFVAADVDVVIDGGAYVTLSPVVLSRGVLHAAGPYRIPNVRIAGRAVATNTPPHGAFRGFGAPQTTFAYERQVDKAARALGMDPFELRRRNRLREGDTTATGQVLRFSVGSTEVLDAVCEQVRRTRPDGTGVGAGSIVPSVDEARVQRGRGLAFYFHGAGFTGSGEDRLKGRASVALTREGSFEVRSASTDIGQGTATIFNQIAAEALGVDVARISTVQPTTERVPDSGPTVASRTCMVVGSVVEKAAGALRERLVAFAAERGLDPDDIDLVARAYADAHGELAMTTTYASPPGVRWDDATYRGDAYPVYGWACCLVDIAVDLETYEVRVERCVHAIDVGKAIHPVLVSGQIEGGTLQALGWALFENVVYRDGRVANPTMTDCIIPTSLEAPEMETILVEVPYPFGPHGAKGVGEIPMDGPAAAVANAVEAALGVPFDTLPISPEAIARALDAHANIERGSS